MKLTHRIHSIKFFSAVCCASLLVACASNDGSGSSSARIQESTQDSSNNVVSVASPSVLKEAEVAEIASKHKLEASKTVRIAPEKKLSRQRQAMMGYQMPSPVYQSAISHDAPVAPSSMPWIDERLEGENYQTIAMNSVRSVLEDPVSTFSIDVDSGSYSNVRRILNQGQLPPKDAVRIEEMVNYFDYQYPQPDLAQSPFSVSTELALAPWSDQHALLRVGLQGYVPEQNERPSANLVFLVDVSGSMSSANKLPLLKKSLLMLARQLTPKDQVSIVVYAGASGVVLEPTSGNELIKIEQALEQLKSGGSTYGQAGIQLAYKMAEQAYIEGGINRVLLATDGDFNVGVSNVDGLKELIERKRKKGVELTTLGFGRGNYNDHLMEQLANVGNGNYAYIDTLHEARKVLVEQMNATLMTIAKDVKIQLEFNPDVVAEYRLLGYENRALAREDFDNDQVDAGEIGAGHRVTALYELALTESKAKRLSKLRYQDNVSGQSDHEYKGSQFNKTHQHTKAQELGFLKLRYKQPDQSKSQLMEEVINKPLDIKRFDQASADFKFAGVVASFGQKLKNDKYLNDMDYQRMINMAQQAKGDDPSGYRHEFINLMRLAEALN